VLVLLLSFKIGEVRDSERELEMAIWEKVYSKTLKFEGGFQKNPKDKGNWTGNQVGVGELKGTKYGISAGSFPNLDIENLTKDQAIEIYRRDYWDALHLGDIESNQIAWKVFDISINCGRGTAAKILQEAVGTTIDGLIGDKTIGATNKSDSAKLIGELVKLQQEHYEKIHNEMNDVFFSGWMIRSEETAPELA
jgi:lysozyme family protein